MVKELFIWALHCIVPPTDLTGARMRRWCVSVTVVLVANTAAMATFSAAAFGLISSLGFTGFASKISTDGQQKTLNSILAYQIAQQITYARTQQCVAEKTGNYLALRFATDKVQQLLPIYKEYSGGPYRLPDCTELATEGVMEPPP